MTLSDEDKKRIEEEERYRNEIRNQTQQDGNTPFYRRKLSWKGGCLTVILLIFIPAIIVSLISGGSKQDNNKPTNTEQELNGSVTIKNGIINITNESNTDWTSCYFDLNSKYGYPDNAFPRTRLEVIKAKEIATIRVTDFVTSDGTRFNIFTIKPQDLMGKCQNGFQYWKWN